MEVERTAGPMAECLPMFVVTVRETGNAWLVEMPGVAAWKTLAVPIGADGSADIFIDNPNTERTGRYLIPAGKGPRTMKFERKDSPCRYTATAQ